MTMVSREMQLDALEKRKNIFCKIFFYYNDKDWKKILLTLSEIKEPFQVITTNYELDKFLKENNIFSKTIRDIYPEEGENTYEIYKRAKKSQQRYGEVLQGIRYRDAEVFPGIENQLLDQLILLEMTKDILEQKTNTIFIFENFLFTYFAILEEAKKNGYYTEIGILQNVKIKSIDPKKSHKILILKNKLSYIKKEYLSFLSKQAILRVLRGDLVNPIYHIKEHIFHPIFVSLLRLILTSSFYISLTQIFKDDPVQSVLMKVHNKTFATYKLDYAFFLTTNKEDLYLKSVYPLIDLFEEKEKSFGIFVIDLQTIEILNNRGLGFVNLFEEVNILSTLFQKMTEGKKMMNKIKKIARENDLQLIHHSNFSEQIKSELFRTMAIIHICDYIFSEYKPKAIVVGTDGVMYGNSAIAIAKKHQIPSYFVPSAIINKNPLHASWYKADKICLYGKQGLDSLEHLKYDSKRLILAGNPKYDFLKKLDSSKCKKNLNENLGIDTSKKLVALAMARWHKKDEEWMSKLINFCNQNGFEIIIKVHPMYKTMQRQESEDKISKIRTLCEDCKYAITYDIDTYTIISAADVVITEYSNVGAEAIMLEKPLITVNFLKEDWKHEQRYHEYNAALCFEDYSELENVLKELLTKGKYLEQLKEGRKKVTDMYNCYNDGKAAQRVFDLITNNSKITETLLQ